MSPEDDLTVAIQDIVDKDKAKKVKAAARASETSPVAARPDYERQLQFPYNPDVMIQYIIDNPGRSHKDYAKHFGQTPGWFAAVLAGDQFQQRLDLRRGEISDPSITATLEERFRALTLRGLDVLQVMMDNPKVQDATVLKATEIGIKALGLGQARKSDEDAKLPQAASLDTLAERLLQLNAANRQAKSVPVAETIQVITPTDVLLQELTGETIDAGTQR